MAPRVGFEPTAYRLTAECSTVELPRIIKNAKLGFASNESEGEFPLPVLWLGDVLLSRAVTSRVPSALRDFTSVFGMGTGVSLLLFSPNSA